MLPRHESSALGSLSNDGSSTDLTTTRRTSVLLPQVLSSSSSVSATTPSSTSAGLPANGVTSRSRLQRPPALFHPSLPPSALPSQQPSPQPQRHQPQQLLPPRKLSPHEISEMMRSAAASCSPTPPPLSDSPFCYRRSTASPPFAGNSRTPSTATAAVVCAESGDDRTRDGREAPVPSPMPGAPFGGTHTTANAPGNDGSAGYGCSSSSLDGAVAVAAHAGSGLGFGRAIRSPWSMNDGPAFSSLITVSATMRGGSNGCRSAASATTGADDGACGDRSRSGREESGGALALTSTAANASGQTGCPRGSTWLDTASALRSPPPATQSQQPQQQLLSLQHQHWQQAPSPQALSRVPSSFARDLDEMSPTPSRLTSGMIAMAPPLPTLTTTAPGADGTPLAVLQTQARPVSTSDPLSESQPVTSAARMSSIIGAESKGLAAIADHSPVTAHPMPFPSWINAGQSSEGGLQNRAPSSMYASPFGSPLPAPLFSSTSPGAGEQFPTTPNAATSPSGTTSATETATTATLLNEAAQPPPTRPTLPGYPRSTVFVPATPTALAAASMSAAGSMANISPRLSTDGMGSGVTPLTGTYQGPTSTLMPDAPTTHYGTLAWQSTRALRSNSGVGYSSTSPCAGVQASTVRATVATAVTRLSSPAAEATTAGGANSRDSLRDREDSWLGTFSPLGISAAPSQAGLVGVDVSMGINSDGGGEEKRVNATVLNVDTGSGFCGSSASVATAIPLHRPQQCGSETSLCAPSPTMTGAADTETFAPLPHPSPPPLAVLDPASASGSASKKASSGGSIKSANIRSSLASAHSTLRSSPSGQQPPQQTPLPTQQQTAGSLGGVQRLGQWLRRRLTQKSAAPTSALSTAVGSGLNTSPTERSPSGAAVIAPARRRRATGALPSSIGAGGASAGGGVCVDGLCMSSPGLATTTATLDAAASMAGPHSASASTVGLARVECGDTGVVPAWRMTTPMLPHAGWGSAFAANSYNAFPFSLTVAASPMRAAWVWLTGSATSAEGGAAHAKLSDSEDEQEENEEMDLTTYGKNDNHYRSRQLPSANDSPMGTIAGGSHVAVHATYEYSFDENDRPVSPFPLRRAAHRAKQMLRGPIHTDPLLQAMRKQRVLFTVRIRKFWLPRQVRSCPPVKAGRRSPSSSASVAMGRTTSPPIASELPSTRSFRTPTSCSSYATPPAPALAPPLISISCPACRRQNTTTAAAAAAETRVAAGARSRSGSHSHSHSHRQQLHRIPSQHRHHANSGSDRPHSASPLLHSCEVLCRSAGSFGHRRRNAESDSSNGDGRTPSLSVSSPDATAVTEVFHCGSVAGRPGARASGNRQHPTRHQTPLPASCGLTSAFPCANITGGTPSTTPRRLLLPGANGDGWHTESKGEGDALSGLRSGSTTPTKRPLGRSGDGLARVVTLPPPPSDQHSQQQERRTQPLSGGVESRQGYDHRHREDDHCSSGSADETQYWKSSAESSERTATTATKAPTTDAIASCEQRSGTRHHSRQRQRRRASSSLSVQERADEYLLSVDSFATGVTLKEDQRVDFQDKASVSHSCPSSGSKAHDHQIRRYSLKDMQFSHGKTRNNENDSKDGVDSGRDTGSGQRGAETAGGAMLSSSAVHANTSLHRRTRHESSSPLSDQEQQRQHHRRPLPPLSLPTPTLNSRSGDGGGNDSSGSHGRYRDVLLRRHLQLHPCDVVPPLLALGESLGDEASESDVRTTTAEGTLASTNGRRRYEECDGEESMPLSASAVSAVWRDRSCGGGASCHNSRQTPRRTHRRLAHLPTRHHRKNSSVSPDVSFADVIVASGRADDRDVPVGHCDETSSGDGGALSDMYEASRARTGAPPVSVLPFPSTVCESASGVTFSTTMEDALDSVSNASFAAAGGVRRRFEALTSASNSNNHNCSSTNSSAANDEMCSGRFVSVVGSGSWQRLPQQNSSNHNTSGLLGSRSHRPRSPHDDEASARASTGIGKPDTYKYRRYTATSRDAERGRRGVNDGLHTGGGRFFDENEEGVRRIDNDDDSLIDDDEESGVLVFHVNLLHIISLLVMAFMAVSFVFNGLLTRDCEIFVKEKCSPMLQTRRKYGRVTKDLSRLAVDVVDHFTHAEQNLFSLDERAYAELRPDFSRLVRTTSDPTGRDGALTAVAGAVLRSSADARRMGTDAALANDGNGGGFWAPARMNGRTDGADVRKRHQLQNDNINGRRCRRLHRLRSSGVSARRFPDLNTKVNVKPREAYQLMVRQRRAMRYLPPQSSYTGDADYSGIDWLGVQWPPSGATSSSHHRDDTKSWPHGMMEQVDNATSRGDGEQVDATREGLCEHDRQRRERAAWLGRRKHRLARAAALLDADPGGFFYLNSKDAFLFNLKTKREARRRRQGHHQPQQRKQRPKRGAANSDAEGRPSPRREHAKHGGKAASPPSLAPQPPPGMPLRTRVAFVSAMNTTSWFSCLSQSSAILAGVPMHYLGFHEAYSHIGRYDRYLEFVEKEKMSDDDILVAWDSDILMTGESPIPFLQEFVYASARSREEIDTAMVRTGQHAPPILFGSEKFCMSAQLYGNIEGCTNVYDEYERAMTREAASYGHVYSNNVGGHRNPFRFLNAGSMVTRVWALRVLHEAMRTFMRIRAPKYVKSDWYCDQTIIATLFVDLLKWELDQSLVHLLILEQEVGHLLPPESDVYVGKTNPYAFAHGAGTSLFDASGGGVSDHRNNTAPDGGEGDYCDDAGDEEGELRDFIVARAADEARGSEGEDVDVTKKQSAARPVVRTQTYLELQRNQLHRTAARIAPLTPAEQKSLRVLSKLRRSFRESLYQPFGVPPALMGLDTTAGFSFNSAEHTVYGEDFVSRAYVWNPCLRCGARSSPNAAVDVLRSGRSDRFQRKASGRTAEGTLFMRERRTGDGDGVRDEAAHTVKTREDKEHSSPGFREPRQALSSLRLVEVADLLHPLYSRTSTPGRWQERLRPLLEESSRLLAVAANAKVGSVEGTATAIDGAGEGEVDGGVIVGSSSLFRDEIPTLLAPSPFLSSFSGTRALQRALTSWLAWLQSMAQPFVHHTVSRLFYHLGGYAGVADMDIASFTDEVGDGEAAATVTTAITKGPLAGPQGDAHPQPNAGGNDEANMACPIRDSTARRMPTGLAFELESAGLDGLFGLRQVRLSPSGAVLTPPLVEMTPYPPLYILRFPFFAAPATASPADTNRVDGTAGAPRGVGPHRRHKGTADAANTETQAERASAWFNKDGAIGRQEFERIIRDEFYVSLHTLVALTRNAAEGSEKSSRGNENLDAGSAGANDGDTELSAEMAAEANIIPLPMYHEAVDAIRTNAAATAPAATHKGGVTGWLMSFLLERNSLRGDGSAGTVRASPLSPTASRGRGAADDVDTLYVFDVANAREWLARRREAVASFPGGSAKKTLEPAVSATTATPGITEAANAKDGAAARDIDAKTNSPVASAAWPDVYVEQPTITTPTRWLLFCSGRRRYPVSLHFSGGWKAYSMDTYKFFFSWYLPMRVSPVADRVNREVLENARVCMWTWEREVSYGLVDLCGAVL